VALVSWFADGLVETPSMVSMPTKKLAIVTKRRLTPAVSVRSASGLNIGEPSGGKKSLHCVVQCFARERFADLERCGREQA